MSNAHPTPTLEDEIELSKGVACYGGAIMFSLLVTTVLLLLCIIGAMNGSIGLLVSAAVASVCYLLADTLASRKTGFHAVCKKFGLNPVHVVSNIVRHKLTSL